MTRVFTSVVAIASLVAAAGAQRIEYPQTLTGPDADLHHGTKVADPYRWLEAESRERDAFVQSQAALLNAFLPRDARAEIAARVRELVEYDAVTAPAKAGPFYFYIKGRSTSARAGSSLVMRPTTGGSERTLVPPDPSSGSFAISFAPSPDGALLAYVESKPGSAIGTLRVLRTGNGQLLGDQAMIPSTLAGPIKWSPDSKGLYYAVVERVDAHATSAVRKQRLFYHPLGGAARQMSESMAAANEILTYGLSADNRRLVVGSQLGSDPRTRVTYRELGETRDWIALVDERTASYTFLGGRGDTLWFYTDGHAPRGRIVAVDVVDGQAPKWREVVKEAPEAISARDQTGGNALGMFGNHLVLTYIRDGQPFLRIFSLEGRLTSTVELPVAGSIWGGFSGQDLDDEVLFWFLGLTDPSTIYRLDLRTGAKSVVHRATLPVDASSIAVSQEFYTSWDGTRIPIFVAHRAGVKRDGRSPALMYGYGALGWVSFIWYQPHVVAWIESGGVYAQPSIRGGGEYGEAWHHAALKTRKMTAVRDYVSAAEWLVQQKITASDRLVGNGGSLSAPLVSAAARLKPDLFAALIIDRPVTDMIRFEQFSGGRYWSPEFGSPSVEAEFRSLLELSPYHNALKPSCVPPTLVMSGELDRTAPLLHGLKLAAALQANQRCDKPVLLKIMGGASHTNFGNTTDQQVESYTDLLTFLRQVLGPAGRTIGSRMPPLANQ